MFFKAESSFTTTKRLFRSARIQSHRSSAKAMKRHVAFLRKTGESEAEAVKLHTESLVEFDKSLGAKSRPPL